MNDIVAGYRAMTTEKLGQELRFLAERERRNVANLLAALMEYDRRRAAQEEGYESTYMFCVRALRYDEGGAYRRIHAARAVAKHPKILPLIVSGELNLTSILLLAPVLTQENRDRVIESAKGKTKREIEFLVAAEHPRPGMPDYHRRLPVAPPAWALRLRPGAIPSQAFETAISGAETGAPPEPAAGAPSSPEASGGFIDALPETPPQEWQAIMPLTVERVRIGFDAGVGIMNLIDRARQVLRHKFPGGRLEDLMTEALQILLDRKDPQRRLGLKAAPPSAPASPGEPRFMRAWKGGRYIPASVKKEVWQRDEGRCAWRLPDGTVCGSRDWIEFDHIRPFTKGGRSDVARNIRLLCKEHNVSAAHVEGVLPPGLSASPGPA